MLNNGYRPILRLKLLAENTGHQRRVPSHIKSFVSFVPLVVKGRGSGERLRESLR